MCFFIGTVLFILLTKLYQDIRKNTFSMLYWIGLSKRKINQITMIEQLTFISVTFIISTIISIGLTWILFKVIIDIPAHIHWNMIIVTAFSIFILTIGFMMMQKHES